MESLQGFSIRDSRGTNASLQVVTLQLLALAMVLVCAPFQMWRCTQNNATVGRRVRVDEDLPSRAARNLMDASIAATTFGTVADVTVVSTAREFQAAVMAGAQDIELRAHVDLTDLALAFNSNVSRAATVLGEIKPSTRSIRGNCTKAPAPASAWTLPPPEWLWEAPQCVIVSDHNIFDAYEPLWLDALYLRRRPSTWGLFFFIQTTWNAELYATRLTIQGNGGRNTSVYEGRQGSKAIYTGCIFDSVGGQTQAFTVWGASLVINASTVSNTPQRNTFIDYIAADAAFLYNGIVAVLGLSASATVLDTAFKNVDAVNLFWTITGGMVMAEGITYSNVTTESARWDVTGSPAGAGDSINVVRPYGEPLKEPSAWVSLPPSAVRPLSIGDPWIVAVRQAWADATPDQFQTSSDLPEHPPPPPPLGVAGDAAASIAAVYTAADFQDAFHEGVRDIEIHAHLDLRTLPVPRNPLIEVPFGIPEFKIGFVGTPIRSIRGKCTTPPTGDLEHSALDVGVDDEEPWRAPRCIIVISEDLFVIDRSRLWIDALHIQVVDGRQVPVPIQLTSWGVAYVTNAVVQGDRSSSAVGVSAVRGGGGLYAEDCVFNALEGGPTQRVIEVTNSNTFFRSCVFRGLSLERVPENPRQWEARMGALYVHGLNSTLALENCTLTNLINPLPLAIDHGGLVYSDNPDHLSVQSVTFNVVQPLPLAALANRSARTPPPPQATDPWFVAAGQALASPPETAYLQSYPLRDNLQATAPVATPLATPDPPPDAPSPAMTQDIGTAPSSQSANPVAGPDGPDDDVLTRPFDPPTSQPVDTTYGDNGEDTPSTGLVVGGVVVIVAALFICMAFAIYAIARRRTLHHSKAIIMEPAELGNGPKPPTGFGRGTPAGTPQQLPPGFNPGAPPPHGTYQYPSGHFHALNPQAYVGHEYSGACLPVHYGAPGHTGGPRGVQYPQQAQAGPPGQDFHVGAGDDLNYMGGVHNTGAVLHAANVGVRGSPSGSEALRNSSLSASSATITNITKMSWTDFQKASSEARSPQEELEVALDAMYGMQARFYYRYQLLSAVDRRAGGQGVVQFAAIVDTMDKVAIKFYLDRSAFQRERELYSEVQLKSVMPATLAAEGNTSGTTCTPYGYTFPPFVIIECGQSLDEWSRDNANKDFITVFQALSHAVRSLRRLHDFGYAHRDIKPGNILRRPKQHDWTLIDFGCCARIGSTASLSYSLKYAAPEVVHTLEAGSRTIYVAAAVDIWSIGVIAFELLTGELAFPIGDMQMSAPEPENLPQEAIAGRAPLPWEGSSEVTQRRLEKLRGLKRTVMRCLDRDPAKRPTAAALVSSWDHTFDHMRTRWSTFSAGSL